MKKVLLTIAILITTLITFTGCEQKQENSSDLKIVTSFYPMYVLTKNIAGDIDGVTIRNMTARTVGCIHNYTLKASDLVNLEGANIFIANGLGIESFTSKIMDTYSKINVITAGENINDLIVEENEINAHIWLSIEKYIMELENIKNGLIKADSLHKEEYEKNAQTYKNNLEKLKEEITRKNLKKKKCVSFSESLAYLAEDFNLDILTIETDHEQNGLSAETISEVIEYIKSNNVKSILIDSETAQNNAKTVEKETGAKIYIMNSCLSGEDDKDNYIKSMKENLKLVESME